MSGLIVHTRPWVRATFIAYCVAAALLSCRSEDLAVAYVYIPDVEVAPGGVAEEAEVAAVRVVVDSLSLGFYPVPTTAPVIGLGDRRIRIEPAVRRSGLSEEIVVYPLYEALAETLTLRSGVVDTLRPTFAYVDGAVIGLEEDFEAERTGLILDLTPGGSAPLTRDSSDARRGDASGLITLDADHPVFELATDLIVPDRARLLDLWVEVDFRGDGILAVALFPDDVPVAAPGQPLSARYFQGALPREEWTRLYFDIVDASNESFVAEGFRLSLLAIYDESLGERQTLLLDNLRVVYR